MTTAQAAARLRKSRSTVARWAASGELPSAFVVPGLRGQILFHRADVEAKARDLIALAPDLSAAEVAS